MYFENACSLRKIKRFLLQQYHISVSHVSIWRWFNHFAAFFRSTSHFLLQNADFQSDEWHADETFIRIQGVQHYLWILLDSETRTVIAWHLSSIRDGPSAYHLFCCAREQTEEQPQTIITDGLASYEMSIQMIFPNVIHHVYESFVDEKNNKMKEFIDANPGIKSRINSTFYFPSYTAPEMAEIFKKHAEISGYELPENWKEPITAYFSTRVNDENFGNGREARALFEKVSVQMAKRIMGDANGGLQNSINEKAIKQCRISDIEGAIRRAREENKQISGRVKVHNRIGF